ncbi:type IV toxin-antitoxin system AbiEi family antitoxin domain-containing protein [Nocardioides sp. zg-1228]|uniref:type IV toxin-antitoxin system AbiEi family antitoxin domain-containing protein n=1 Tax=Nocardioides sp. zg-1228 TaxID=2763008 RepID=UPI00164238F0|nr:type IV toxin-antitoxin system AbiEi family antitoxin domain-containing protein [Nocardioides sp. zg-1228]MBC2932937.1 type IV toxin-antitoxin system AbiEi family antitoxin domain-containing protein [Nocardioides sp. zg-1228]QSF56862.1 type IV toxin-antitoxin system AbiEi family antitoxin domain-containing protein [Nocardioides sp. zg-1228]
MTTYRQTLRELAFDTHGIVTIADAEAAGVPAVAVRQLAERGALERRGSGVYRMTEVPRGPLDEFAEAVALVGPGAVLADESVLAAHDLAQINLRRIKVAVPSPSRVRKGLPRIVELVRKRVPAGDRQPIDGIPAMSISAALEASAGRVMTERLVAAAEQARARGLISPADADQAIQAVHRGSRARATKRQRSSA